jgi:hypothetical protein
MLEIIGRFILNRLSNLSLLYFAKIKKRKEMKNKKLEYKEVGCLRKIKRCHTL